MQLAEIDIVESLQALSHIVLDRFPDGSLHQVSECPEEVWRVRLQYMGGLRLVCGGLGMDRVTESAKQRRESLLEACRVRTGETYSELR